MSIDGSTTWRIGAQAEQYRLGPAWEVAHHVLLPWTGKPNEVDHVAAGPYGVLVVETKWTNDELDLEQLVFQ